MIVCVFIQDINLGFCELSQDVTMIVADSLANKEELRKIDLNGMTLAAAITLSCFAAAITLSCLLFIHLLCIYTHKYHWCL